MKTALKKVTVEEFFAARATAQAVINEKHPRTRLAYWCGEFISMNKHLFKSLQKEQKALTMELNKEIERTMVMNALCDKETKALISTKEQAYFFDNKGEMAVKEKQWEIAKEMEPILEEFLAKECEVKCIDGKIEIAEKIDFATFDALQGYAFNNPSEFHEPIEDPA